MKIAPTLIIGIGGTGSRIVSKVMEKVQRESPGIEQNLKFAVLDTDANDLAKIRQDNKTIITVQTSVGTTVEKTLEANPEVREWFPSHPALASKVLTQGAGQVRAVSRLALEACITQGKFNVIHDAIRELNELSIEEFTQSPRVIIAGTITGGTGAGLALPLGMHLRQYFEQELRRDDAIIRGFFILPGVMTQIYGLDSPSEMASLNRNAYAVVRELNAFMRKGDGIDMSDFYGMELSLPSSDGGSRETYNKNIKPYDYCFLMDAQTEAANSLHSREDYEDFAANTIYAQSLSPMSAQGNSSEDNVIQELVNNETSVPGVDMDFSGYISGSSPRFGAAGSAEVAYPMDEVLNYVAEVQASKCMSDEWLAADEYYRQKHQEEIDEDKEAFTPEYVLHARYYEENNLLERDGVKDDFVGRIAEQVVSRSHIQADGTRTEERDRVEECIAGLWEFIDNRAEANQTIKQSSRRCRAQLRNLFSQTPATYVELEKCIEDSDEEMLGVFGSASFATKDFKDNVLDLAAPDANAVAALNFTFFDLASKGTSFHPIGNGSNNDLTSFHIEGYLQRDVPDEDDPTAPNALHPNAVRLFLALLNRRLIDEQRKAQERLHTAEERIEIIGNRDWDPNTPGIQDIETAIRNAIAQNVRLSDRVLMRIKKLFSRSKETRAADELAQLQDGVSEFTSEGADDDFDDDQEFADIQVYEFLGLLDADYNNLKDYLHAQYAVSITDAALDYVERISEAYKEFYMYLREQIPAIGDDIVAMETSRRYNVTARESDGVLGQTTRYVCCNRTCLTAISNQVVTATSSFRVSGVLCAEIYKHMYQYAHDSSDANLNSFERALKKNKNKSSEQARKDRDALAQLRARRRKDAFDQVFQEAVIDYWREYVMKRHASIIDMDIIDAIRQEALYMNNAATEKEQDAYIRQVLTSGFSLSKPLLEIDRDNHMRDIKVCMFSGDLIGQGNGVGDIMVRDERKLGYVEDCLKANNGYADPNLRKGRILYYQCVYGIRASRLPRFSTQFNTETLSNDDSRSGNYFRAYHSAIETLGPIHESNNLVTPHISKDWHYITAMPELSAAEEYRQKYNIMRAFLYGLVFGKITRYDARPRPWYKVRWKSGDVENLVVRNGSPCDYFYEVFDSLNYNPRAVSRLNGEFDKDIEAEVLSNRTTRGPRASRLLEHLQIVDTYCDLEQALGIEDADIRSHDVSFDAVARNGVRAFTLKEFDKTRTRSIFDIPLFYAWSLPKNELRDESTARMVEMCFDIIVCYLRNFSSRNSLDHNAGIVLFIEMALFLHGFEKLKEDAASDPMSSFVGIADLEVVQQIMVKLYAWFDDPDRLIDDRLRSLALEMLQGGTQNDSDV